MSTFVTFCAVAYLQNEDSNVIVVDWGSISRRPYIWASNRVIMVGQFVSTMIDFLEKQGIDLSKTILIGHSLGAHVVGLAARNAQGEVGFVVGKFLMNYMNLIRYSIKDILQNK